MAQRLTGSIKGKIVDEDGSALPGVTVNIASPAMQGKKTFITSADGNYRFPLCPPDLPPLNRSRYNGRNLGEVEYGALGIHGRKVVFRGPGAHTMRSKGVPNPNLAVARTIQVYFNKVLRYIVIR